jgi:prefoldin subunit 5
MLELLNKYKKQIAYVIVGLFVLYGIIWLATREPKMSADLKASIDSLTVANKKLMKSQEHMDSAITAYESKIEQIDNHISNIKNKTTIINTYYNDLGQQVDQYVPNQVDSFFHQRYNY